MMHNAYNYFYWPSYYENNEPCQNYNGEHHYEENQNQEHFVDPDFDRYQNQEHFVDPDFDRYQKWRESTKQFIERTDSSKDWRPSYRFNAPPDKRMHPPPRHPYSPWIHRRPFISRREDFYIDDMHRNEFNLYERPYSPPIHSRDLRPPKRRRISHLDDIHRNNYDYDECDRFNQKPHSKNQKPHSKNQFYKKNTVEAGLTNIVDSENGDKKESQKDEQVVASKIVMPPNQSTTVNVNNTTIKIKDTHHNKGVNCVDLNCKMTINNQDQQIELNKNNDVIDIKKSVSKSGSSSDMSKPTNDYNNKDKDKDSSTCVPSKTTIINSNDTITANSSESIESIAEYIQQTQLIYAPLQSPLSSIPVPSTPVPLTPMATPMTSTPMASTLVASTPMASTPMASTPKASTPVASTPMASTPMASTLVASTLVETTPVASTPMASTPVPSTPVPLTPVPSTPVPLTPVPLTPVPSTPVPSIQIPSTAQSNPETVLENLKILYQEKCRVIESDEETVDLNIISIDAIDTRKSYLPNEIDSDCIIVNADTASPSSKSETTEVFSKKEETSRSSDMEIGSPNTKFDKLEKSVIRRKKKEMNISHRSVSSPRSDKLEKSQTLLHNKETQISRRSSASIMETESPSPKNNKLEQQESTNNNKKPGSSPKLEKSKSVSKKREGNTSRRSSLLNAETETHSSKLEKFEKLETNTALSSVPNKEIGLSNPKSEKSVTLSKKKETHNSNKSSNMETGSPSSKSKKSTTRVTQGQKLNGVKRRQSDEIKSVMDHRSKLIKIPKLLSERRHSVKERINNMFDIDAEDYQQTDAMIDSVGPKTSTRTRSDSTDTKKSKLMDNKKVIKNILVEKHAIESNIIIEEDLPLLPTLVVHNLMTINRYSVTQVTIHMVTDVDDCCDEATLMESPDIQDKIETIKVQDLTESDDVIEIKKYIPIIDLTEEKTETIIDLTSEIQHCKEEPKTNNLETEKEDKQNIINILEHSKISPGETITLYRGEETLNTSLDVQATSVSISSGKEYLDTKNLLKTEQKCTKEPEVIPNNLKETQSTSNSTDADRSSLRTSESLTADDSINLTPVTVVTEGANCIENVTNISKELTKNINNGTMQQNLSSIKQTSSAPKENVPANTREVLVTVVQQPVPQSVGQQSVCEPLVVQQPIQRPIIQQPVQPIVQPSIQRPVVLQPIIPQLQQTAVQHQLLVQQSIVNDKDNSMQNSSGTTSDKILPDKSANPLTGLQHLLIQSRPNQNPPLQPVSSMYNDVMHRKTPPVENRPSGGFQQLHNPSFDYLTAIANAFAEYIHMYDISKKADRAYETGMKNSQVSTHLVREELWRFSSYQNVKLKQFCAGLVNDLKKIPPTGISDLKLFVNYLLLTVQKKNPEFTITGVYITLNQLMDPQKEFYCLNIYFKPLYAFVNVHAGHLYKIGQRNKEPVKRVGLDPIQLKRLLAQINQYIVIRRISRQTLPAVSNSVNSQMISTTRNEPGNRELFRSQSCIETNPSRNGVASGSTTSNQITNSNKTNTNQPNHNPNNFIAQTIPNSGHSLNLEKQSSPLLEALSKKPATVNSFPNIQNSKCVQTLDANLHNVTSTHNSVVQTNSPFTHVIQAPVGHQINPTVINKSSHNSTEISCNPNNFQQQQIPVVPDHNHTQNNINYKKTQNLLTRSTSVGPSASFNYTHNYLIHHKPEQSLNQNKSLTEESVLHNGSMRGERSPPVTTNISESAVAKTQDNILIPKTPLEQNIPRIFSKEQLPNVTTTEKQTASLIETHTANSNVNQDVVQNKPQTPRPIDYPYSDISSPSPVVSEARTCSPLHSDDIADTSKVEADIIDEIIDLTWIDDVDPKQIENEVSLFIKEEPVENDVGEVILNQEQFPDAPPPSDGIKSPFDSEECYNELLPIERLCICEKPAEYVCGCRMVMYCSGTCQQKHWKAHKSLCLKYTSQKLD